MSIREIMARHHQARTPGPDDAARRQQLADVLEENICTIVELRQEDERRKSTQDRIADWITAFSGSMSFLYLHAVWFGFWVLLNIGSHPMLGFDPYPFGLLTMIVSLEAIFLSTFVLISQNRMGEVADKRADLDLQIDLLAEYEVTRILRLVDAMATQMGIDEAHDPQIDELKTPVAPANVLQEIKAREDEAKKR